MRSRALGGSLSLVSSAASVPAASRCQRRSSSLPRFASERGYRPRPEEPPWPKQQFVPERVMRKAQRPHPSRRHNRSQQHRKGRSVPRSTHPSSVTRAKAPGTCIKMSWCLGRKKRKRPPPPVPSVPPSHMGPGLHGNPSPNGSSLPLRATFKRTAEERVQFRNRLTLKERMRL